MNSVLVTLQDRLLADLIDSFIAFAQSYWNLIGVSNIRGGAGQKAGMAGAQ